MADSGSRTSRSLSCGYEGVEAHTRRLGHLFQEASTGSVNEYAQLKPEFAPEFLEILVTWLTDQLGRQ